MTTMKALLASIIRFARSRRASAAVEFAVIAPLAILLYFGAAEVSDAVMTNRKVTQVARTLVDLSSQQSTSPQALSYPTPQGAITGASLDTIMAAAATMLTPKPTTSLTMTISEIDVANGPGGVCCAATVRWSYTQGGTRRPCAVNLQAGPLSGGSSNQMPSTLMPTGTYLPTTLAFLVADVSYTYQPLVATGSFAFAPAMQRTIFMMPRTSGDVIASPVAGSGKMSVCY